MALFRKYDFQSIYEQVEAILDFDYKRHDPHSEYFDEYEEQICELGCIAGDFYNELEAIKQEIYWKLPAREIEFFELDDCGRTAMSWWNTTVAFLYDTDMVSLLESENRYFADEEKEKQKRINAFKRLTKEQQLFLFTTVCGFITRFQDVVTAFEVVKASVEELDRHQALMCNSNGQCELPQSAFVA